MSSGPAGTKQHRDALMATKKKSGGSGKGGGNASNAGGKTIEGTAAEQPKKKKRTNPLAFIQQVRSEGSKVTWTSRNETFVSTIMVLIMVLIMALFFFGVDQFLRFSVCTVLPIDCAGAS